MPLLLNKWVWAAMASLVLIVGAYVWLRFHDHAIAAAADARCAARVSLAMEEAQIKANAAQAAYTKRLEDAQHEYEVNLDNARGRVLLRPIWLRDNQICPGAMPGAAAQAAGKPAGAGGAVGAVGSNTDIRPAVEAYKMRVERLVEQCRRMDATWP